MQDFIADYVEELLHEGDHLKDCTNVTRITFTRYRTVALKHVRKLFES